MMKRTRNRINKAGRKTLVILSAALILLPTTLHAAVEKVEGGIKFIYYDPDAGTVSIAGSFNNWNMEANPLVRGEDGNWTIVLDLGPGKHEYKFVVDGAWITDFENPNTKADGYGGMNSIVEVDPEGEIVTRGMVRQLSNTGLSPRIFIDGRYLTRIRTEKNYEGDPRWRMIRPTTNIDLNFKITISEMAEGYVRLRVDSDKEFLQPNNISAALDEGHIAITPAVLNLTGYYNMEVLQSTDPLNFFGDIDHPGTLFDDHFMEGKGTAGLVFSTSAVGFDIDAFAANAHDADIYNDPDLFDNTGTDLISVRASKRIGFVTPGLDFFYERDIWWLDFTDRVGQVPANTGIPRLDAHLDESGDPSDWFEFVDRDLYGGFDLSLHLLDDRLVPQFEYLRGTFEQEFVTSNRSGINLDNGPINVPILDRDREIWYGKLNWAFYENRLTGYAEHARDELKNANPAESRIDSEFLPNDEANQRIYYTIESDPELYVYNFSDFHTAWNGTKWDLRLRVRRDLWEFEKPYSGETPWYYELSATPGVTWTPVPRFMLEYEQQFAVFEGSSGLADDGSRLEGYVRSSYGITGTLSAILDVRLVRYDFDEGPEKGAHTYTNPFIGFEYTPMRKVSLVLAYGFDPLNFDIDYDGRHTRRWDFRNQYTWDNPDATILDAEQALKDKRVITLRAQFRF